jgi:hypothetical protein
MQIPKPATGDLQLANASDDDENSFRTPLNHAGIYGLFLVSELTGATPDPLTEWALSWISELAQDHPEPPIVDGSFSGLAAQIHSWVPDIIKAAQEQGEYLARSLDQGSLAEGGHEAVRTTSLENISDRLEANDIFGMGGDADYPSSPVNGDVLVTPGDGSVRPIHALVSKLRVDSMPVEQDGDKVDAAANAPQAHESDLSVDEASSDEAVPGEASADPLTELTYADSFAFASSVDPSTEFGTSITADVLELSASPTDIDPLDTAMDTDQQVTDPLMDLGFSDSGALPDTTVTSQTVTTFINADDFIV